MITENKTVAIDYGQLSKINWSMIQAEDSFLDIEAEAKILEMVFDAIMEKEAIKDMALSVAFTDCVTRIQEKVDSTYQIVKQAGDTLSSCKIK